MATSDLAAHTATWETPIRTAYRDVEVPDEATGGGVHRGDAALGARLRKKNDCKRIRFTSF